MVIGLSLSPVAINSSLYNQGSFDVKYLIVSSIVVLTMIIVSIFAKGFFKLVPILIAVVVGYLVSLPLGLVDVETIANANWFGIKNYEQIFTLPEFSLSGILAIAPVALVVFIEHIGDITTNSAVVGKDFFKEPGVHRTMLGDGLATMVQSLLGGPASTTYR